MSKRGRLRNVAYVIPYKPIYYHINKEELEKHHTKTGGDHTLYIWRLSLPSKEGITESYMRI